MLFVWSGDARPSDGQMASSEGWQVCAELKARHVQEYTELKIVLTVRDRDPKISGLEGSQLEGRERGGIKPRPARHTFRKALPLPSLPLKSQPPPVATSLSRSHPSMSLC